METVVGVEGSDEGKCEESGVEKSSSSLSSPKQIADPVVYKLVRVCFHLNQKFNYSVGGSSFMRINLKGELLLFCSFLEV